MQISEIQKIIDKNDAEIKVMEEKSRKYEALRDYDGQDKVISSIELWDDIQKNKKAETFNALSKIPKLDDIIGGFREGQVVVVSAQTGEGKSSFCQTLTKNFSEQGIPCIFFSYEMGNEEFLAKFPNIPVFYMPAQTKQNSLVWLESKVYESIAKYKTKIVFIDHLHFLLEMEKMAQAKNLSLLIGMMMRELKRLALEHSLIIFLISHVKKTQFNQTPELDDLRDSSFVAQESDIVMMLRRETEQDRDNARIKIKTNKTILSVLKNRRTGNLGNVKLIYFDNQFTEEYGEDTGRDKLPEISESIFTPPEIWG